MNDRNTDSHDITRITFAVLFIGVQIAASFWVFRPFLSSFIWAAMIVIATWPLLLALQKWLWRKRWVAVAVMTVALLLVFIVPLSLAIPVIVDRADEIVGWAKSLPYFSFPPPPDWLHRLPVAGPTLAMRWQQLAAMDPEEISGRLGPYAGKLAGWFLAQAGSAGMMLVRFFLTVLIAAILYAKGEKAAAGALRFARRLAGERGERAAILAAQSVRAVALGVVLTGLIQSAVGGIGLAVAGVPAAGILTGIMFILCLAQLGPAFVLFPAVAWVYWSGDPWRGTLLLAWAIFATTFDNFLRPMLIRKGVDLPLLLIFPGVIGGLIAFGVIGLFIGPMVLAVSYTLLSAWVSGGVPDGAPGPGGATLAEPPAERPPR